MKIRNYLLAVMLSSTSLASQAGYVFKPAEEKGSIAVANRAAGTVSVIDVTTDTVTDTVSLPAADNPSEPMYVVYKENRLYVGDRANNRVVVFDSFAFNPVAEIPAGNGVFHMWAAKYAQLLLVNNDIDNTVTMIDTNSLEALDTLSLPADLTQQGFKPHDVFVSDSGRAAFISMIDGQPGNDYVLKYSLVRKREVARQEVGGDPHLFIPDRTKYRLYVPSQDSDTVAVLSTHNLRVRRELTVPNAHGVFASGRRLYVTNISEGGTQGLYTIDMRGNRVVDIDDTSFAVPHNISVTNDGRKIYITHSGATQDKVSVFETQPGVSLPVLVGEVTAQANPFGLAYIPH